MVIFLVFMEEKGVGGGGEGGGGSDEAGSGGSKMTRSESSYQLISPEMLAKLSADAYGTTPMKQNDAASKITSYDLKHSRKKKH